MTKSEQIKETKTSKAWKSALKALKKAWSKCIKHFEVGFTFSIAIKMLEKRNHKI